MLIMVERKLRVNMYKFISGFSLLIRVYLCYVTIDTIPIFSNELVNYVVLELISLYTILWAVSFFENKIVINKLDIQSSSERAISYFIIYCLNLAIMYGIMLLLVKYGVLPIVL